MIEVRTIQCPVDFTPISRRNLRMAVEMSKRIGARLILHHNISARPPGYMSVSWMWSEEKEAGAEKEVAAVPAQLEALSAEIPGGIEYEARMTRGPLAESVLSVARSLPSDLIIMGTHGKSSAAHDSLTEQIVIQAPCSVLTIGEAYSPEAVFDAPDKPRPDVMRFLVPVDFTPRSRGVLDFAFALAEGMPHRVDLLHVVRGGQGRQQDQRETAAARERLERLVPEHAAGRTEAHARIGDAVKEILKTAVEIDALCIVMGAHAKGILGRLLFGTTTLSILHGAACPVWFVPESMTARR